MKLATAIAASAVCALAASTAAAGTLVINANTSDPAPRAAFEDVIAQFEAAHPDVEVEFNVFDHEAYKTAIRNWLGSEPPDVVFWFAGERMNAFVSRGLFEDVSDLWDDMGLHEQMASARSAMTIDDRQWGVPYTYYQWGVYYRSDIFAEHGVAVPQTYDELLAACGTLRDAGISPFTIGTKYLWTAAGWFDYINLRTNGLDYHLGLMAGQTEYTDQGVRDAFAQWQRAVDAGCFIEDHTSYSWQEAIPFLVNGDAAMYLMGNFLVAQAISGGLDADSLGFFQFPVIDESVGMYEDAPIDTLHIPVGAENPEDARKFLAFVAQADVQTAINAALLQLPPNSGSEVGDDPFLQAGFNMLSAADGIAQFYDRDTTPDMARAGMEGFQEFMVAPDRLDRILTQIERTRQRIFE